MVALATPLALAACADDEGSATTEPAGSSPAGTVAAAPSGLVTVSPEQGAATIAAPPPGLVVLDVRTPEEFGEGHLDGAVLLDFYEPDFAAGLAELDPEVPYVLYCRSGNRSGQTLAMMDELGFASVENIDGGIVAWQDAGLPVTGG